jgi:ParB family transcriptional regulator, chromosome partitioning protein
MAAIEEHKPAEKRRALGRGLDSLLPSGPRVVTSPSQSVVVPAPTLPPPVVIPAAMAPAIAEPGPELVTSVAPGEISEIHASSRFSQQQREVGHPTVFGGSVHEIPLDLIDENPYQTRKTFDQAALNELAESIKASGLAQPVVVRPGANGRYVLVLGERRCRASKLAGKTSVLAIVRQLGNEQAAEMTVVENLQRQDLNCLEQAQAFTRLSHEFNLTQEQIAKRVGSSRESVANYMRLLKLPDGVLELIGAGKLGFSEARVLLEALSYLDPSSVEEMARNAVASGWTVRELKSRVDALQNPAAHEPTPLKPVDPNVKAAENELQRLLGMRVRITDHKGKGTVLIQYRSVEDFDRLLDVLQAR